MKLQFLENECWYGGATSWGGRMPIGKEDVCTLELCHNKTPNQAMPLFLSNKGRCLWASTGMDITFDHGEITCPQEVILTQAGTTLKDAYQYAVKEYVPFSGKAPAEKLFSAPIFNSWIELTFHQTQQGILEYAHAIVDNGFEPGVLMIDDGWSEYYGMWTFHSGRFPDPKAMLKELHSLGFSVVMWVVPYVSPDSAAYRYAMGNGYLVMQPDGNPYLARWWNGCSAVVDLSNQQAADWLHGQFAQLMELGVDGFKFDGGDAIYAQQDNVTQKGLTPNQQCQAWCEFGQRYAFNEYRSTWLAGGMPLFQRLCDKQHSWGENGIAALLPDTLAQGITGHPFGCADMVGGGEYLNFAACSDRLDRELFVCHSGASCLMPAIQFSAAPWRVLTEKELKQIHRQLELRKQYLPYLLQQIKQSAKTGEPVVRYMEYEYPNQGCERILDQFMLGDALLVAPVLEKGAKKRKVWIPKGSWNCRGNRIESSGEWKEFVEENWLPIVLEKVKTHE